MRARRVLKWSAAAAASTLLATTLTSAQSSEPITDGEYTCDITFDQGGPGQQDSYIKECVSVATHPAASTTTTTTVAPTTTLPPAPVLPMGGIATGTVWSNPVTTDLNLISSIVPGGFVRSDYTWKTVQPTNATTWNWSVYDARIDAIQAAGLEVLPMLGYTPAWANGGNADDKFPPATGFTDEWQNFCHEFAERYIPEGVVAFEVWNEPNINRFWKPAPNTADYVNKVLIPCSTGLRQAAATAGIPITVITAGTSPATNGTNIDPRTWVTQLYSNNAKAHFDAIAHHPYTWPWAPDRDSHIAPNSFNPNQWNAMIQTKAIRDTMVANGDSAKRIWATEVGLPSRDAGPHHGATGGAVTGSNNFVSHETMALRITQIFDYWFGMDGSSSTWIGPLIWYQHRNQSPEPLGTNTEGGFGVVYNSGVDKPGSPITPRASLTTAFATHG